MQKTKHLKFKGLLTFQNRYKKRIDEKTKTVSRKNP